MQLAVWKVGEWLDGKFAAKDGQTYKVQRVVFKNIDKTDKKSYFLNLDMKQPETVEKWKPYIVEGTVLDVVLIPKGVGFVKNDTTINKFEPFKVIRDVTKETNQDDQKA